MLDFNADAEFTAEVQPLFDGEGREISKDFGQRVIRDDTGETIGLCGPNFKPVQHRDVIDPLLDHLAKNAYEIVERAPTRSGLYDLAGERGCFVHRQFTDNGAVMRTDVITGDFIKPTGATAYLDQGPDTMLWKISTFNSHNGSLAVRQQYSYERLLCMNGMTRPDFSTRVYGKHTGNFNFDAIKKKMQNAFNGMTDDADRFGLWASTPITFEVAETMLQQTVARLPNKANGEAHFSAPLVNKILEQFKLEDRTVWGLFQAVTHWQTHGEARANSDKIKTTIGRESRVASMLNSRPWKELVAA